MLCNLLIWVFISLVLRKIANSAILSTMTVQCRPTLSVGILDGKGEDWPPPHMTRLRKLSR